MITSQGDAFAGLTTLGVAPAGSTPYAGATLAGGSVAADDLIVMYTYAGDASLDGFISGDDYTAIDFNIQAANAFGYFNFDGFISGDDYTLVDFNIIAQGSPIAV